MEFEQVIFHGVKLGSVTGHFGIHSVCIEGVAHKASGVAASMCFSALILAD